MTEPPKWADRLLVLLPSAGLFGGLLYFIGRRYVETYYDTLGVPPDVLRLEVADYVFEGAQLVRLMLAVAFTILAIVLYRLFTSGTTNGTKDSKDPVAEKCRRRFRCFVICTGTIGFGASSLGLAQRAWPEGEANPVFVGVILLVLIAGAIVGVALFLKQELLGAVVFACRRKWCAIASLSAVLVVMPYSGAGAMGVIIGTLDSDSSRIGHLFDSVVLTADRPAVQELSWKKVDEERFQTEDKLYLLLVNDGNLFFRAKGRGKRVFVVPTDQLSSYTLSDGTQSEEAEPQPSGNSTDPI